MRNEKQQDKDVNASRQQQDDAQRISDSEQAGSDMDDDTMPSK